MKENPRVGDTFISFQKMGKKVFKAEVEFLEYEARIFYENICIRRGIMDTSYSELLIT